MSLIRVFLFLCVGFIATIHAQCAPKPQPATQPSCHPPHTTIGGDWFTRLRALYILPNDSSGSVNTIPNSGVSVNPCWTGEFDLGYMFTRNLGLELILGTCRNTLMGKKALSGTKIGTTWLLPPTLTFQWRLFSDSIVQPYVGAGANYTLFYSSSCSLPDTSISLSHSWGPAVQGGIDFFFYSDWLFNLDVKYVWIDTQATLSGGTPGKVSVDINPWLFGFGIGRKW
ncbi:MAG: OmpW family protein [Chlamydiae bacterium]|nr:OmpW family protein [Chlamydiota bacterium]